MNTTLSPLIHLIDDDAAVRDSLALLISTVGLRVQTWADPQAFLAEFDRQGIGAIVLDVRMPGISGLAMLDTLGHQGVQHGQAADAGHTHIQHDGAYALAVEFGQKSLRVGPGLHPQPDGADQQR